MELKCTNCNDNIDSRLANIQTDLIQCSSCRTIHKLSQLVNNQSNRTNQYKSTYKSNYDHREIASISDNLPEKPRGSKLEVFATYSSVEIIAPPSGLKGMDFFVAGFSGFWLAFVAFWTFMAAQASIIFAMFSIPFWLVGLGMASSLMKRLVEKQYIEIDNRNITIRRKGLFFSSEEEIPLYSIDRIDFKNVKFKNSFSAIGNTQLQGANGSKTLKAPTIQMGVKDISFLENALPVEQDWAIELLKKAVTNNKFD